MRSRLETLLAALILLPAPHRDASEIRSLGRSDDVWNVPALEAAFDARLAELSRYPHRVFPRELEEELVEALAGLERLAPESAESRARALLALASSGDAAFEARAILVRGGDLSTIRLALHSYLQTPERWRAVLSRATDPRLRDFRETASTDEPLSRRHFLSTLEVNLSRATDRVSLRALLRWAESSSDVSSPRRVLAALPRGTAYDARIERWLARNEAPEVTPTESSEPHRPDEGGRGLALLLLSSSGDEDKRAAAAARRADWSEAIALGGPAVSDALNVLLGAPSLESWIREAEPDPAFLDALAIVPLPAARMRLEEIASREAVAALVRRDDRVLSLPFLGRLRQGADPSLSRDAGLALLSMGAPGSTAFLRTELASGRDLEGLLPAALAAPIDPELLLGVLAPLAMRAEASPSAFAALSQFHELHPGPFLSLLSAGGSLAERAYLVMSLSSDRKRLPLLLDAATGALGTVSSASRDAAFEALAEADLGWFATRLHRLAGDSDRAVRFRAAAALVPSGEPWTLRLLLANVEKSSPLERSSARRAVSRLPPPRAADLLRQTIEDGTAGSFGVTLFLDLGGDAFEARADRGLQAKLWALVKDDALASDETALLAASRLAHPQAIAAVTRLLNER
jgi:hypothetical protein